jgi:hypothetical protein
MLAEGARPEHRQDGGTRVPGRAILGAPGHAAGGAGGPDGGPRYREAGSVAPTTA